MNMEAHNTTARHDGSGRISRRELLATTSCGLGSLAFLGLHGSVVAREARQILLTDCRCNGLTLAAGCRIVAAHGSLKLGKLVNDEGLEVCLAKTSCLGCRCAIGSGFGGFFAKPLAASFSAFVLN